MQTSDVSDPPQDRLAELHPKLADAWEEVAAMRERPEDMKAMLKALGEENRACPTTSRGRSLLGSKNDLRPIERS